MSTSSMQRRLMAMEELTKGMGFATELLGMLQDDTARHQAQYLAGRTAAHKIEQAFSSALSVLISDEAAHGHVPDLISGEVSCSGSPGVPAQPSHFEGSTCKFTLGGDRRSHHKRRAPGGTSTTVTASPLDDGHGWRKYGQKRILNAEHPRCYFRCTYKDDQGCKATKTVQRMEGQESKFLVSYTGQHTCNASHHPPPVIVDCPPDQDVRNMLSFESDFRNTNSVITYSNMHRINDTRVEKKQRSVLDASELGWSKMTQLEPFECSSDDLSKVPDLVRMASELISPSSPCSRDILGMADSIFEAAFSTNGASEDHLLIHGLY